MIKRVCHARYPASLLRLLRFAHGYYIIKRDGIDIQKEVIEILLKNGADVNIGNKGGATPLILYFKDRENSEIQKEIIELLLSHGVDIYIVDDYGKTAYDYALENCPDLAYLVKPDNVE